MRAESAFAVFGLGGHMESCAGLPIDALSLGEGVFETVLVLSGRPVFSRRHEARLAASCAELGIALQREARQLYNTALEWAAATVAPRLRLRIAVFGGSRDEEPIALAAARPAVTPAGAARLATAALRRQRGAVASMHKTTSYIENLHCLRRAREAGFHDALWLDDAGDIAETCTANIFFAEKGALVTPGEGAILPGVVRGWILENAANMGIAATQEQITAVQAQRFEHAFMTNSLIGIIAVVAIGELRFADVRSEKWFGRLAAAYEDAVNNSASAAPG